MAEALAQASSLSLPSLCFKPVFAQAVCLCLILRARMFIRVRLVVASLALTLLTAVPAGAQWFAAAYLGGNYTHPADVTIVQPARDTAMTIRQVEFAARPFASPQYYGWRVGRLFGETRRYGLELEFLHLKVIGKTDRSYTMAGTLDGTTVDGTRQMDTLVQRYAMTHGLNYLLINGVARRSLANGRFALVGRLGAGPTYPHAETTIDHRPREQYEFAGIGAHLSAGLDVRLRSRLSLMAEYKLTGSRPRISTADGSGQVRALTHQAAVGLAYGLTR